MKHRITFYAIVLLCVWVTFCAVPAYAAPQTGGTCGEDVRWSFDATTRTLTISGTGNMDNGELGYRMPWQELYEQIEHIVIEEGITSICAYAFEGSTQLRDVVIAKSVTSIGESAFERAGLRHIELHDGITDIGISAFEWSSLEEVVVPAGVTELAFGVFRECESLRSVVLPEGLTYIHGDVFTDCSALRSIIIPDSVTVMVDAFLRCAALETVVLGEGLSFISGSCFQDCTALREVTVPDSVTTIGRWAFQNCISLEKVTIGAGVEEISTNAFWGCAALKAFAVDPDNPVLCSDDAGAIYSKDRTTLLFLPTGYVGVFSVPDGTETIGWGAGYECLGLTGLRIPDSVTEIYTEAFLGCTALRDLELGNGVTYIHTQAFRGCESLEFLVFPASLTQLDNSAFAFCGGLRTIEFCGACPYFESHVFSGVTADAYYPADDATWKVDLSAVSDQICWKPKCAGAHTFVKSEAVAPSCDVSGKTESTYCGVCGFVSVYAAAVPATGHSYGPWKYITSPDTPENERRVERTCAVCGFAYSELAVNVDASQLPEEMMDVTVPGTQPEKPIKGNRISVVAIVIAAVVVCFVAVEVHLARKNKKG